MDGVIQQKQNDILRYKIKLRKRNWEKREAEKQNSPSSRAYPYESDIGLLGFLLNRNWGPYDHLLPCEVGCSEGRYRETQSRDWPTTEIHRSRRRGAARERHALHCWEEEGGGEEAADKGLGLKQEEQYYYSAVGVDG